MVIFRQPTLWLIKYYDKLINSTLIQYSKHYLMLKRLKILKHYYRGILKPKIWKVDPVGSLSAYILNTLDVILVRG